MTCIGTALAFYVVHLQDGSPHRRYPYFDVVVGLAWSNYPERYAGGSVDSGRGSHAGQAEGMTQNKRGTLVLQFELEADNLTL
jgi:hypothetical protein